MESDIVLWLNDLNISPEKILRLLFSAMIAILFLQSGIDKIMNWSGEKGFYQEHFKKTFLKSLVGVLMPVITVSEVLAGALSAIGIVIYLAGGSADFAILGMFLACISVIQLFFGQRIAKDYAGSAVLIPYFLLASVGLYFYLI